MADVMGLVQRSAGNQAATALADVARTRLQNSHKPVHPPARQASRPDALVLARKAAPSPGGTGAGGGGAGVGAYGSKVRTAAAKITAKKPPSSHVKQAQAAAKGPSNEKMAGGKAAQVGDMSKAKAGSFNEAAFIAAVEKAVAASAPKNLEQAEDFGDSGAAKTKKKLQSRVDSDKKKAAGAVEKATEKPPNPARGKAKRVVPMRRGRSPRAPRALGAAKVMPKKKPATATDVSAPGKEVDSQLASEDVTEQQLAQSEEPSFVDAVQSKKEGDKFSATAPGPVRAAESNILNQAKAAVGAAEKSGLSGMGQARRGADSGVGGSKSSSKTKDEAKRKQVADRIEQIYSGTQADVKAELAQLDAKLDSTFTSGEAEARAAFEREHKSKFKAWKDKRYGGIRGKGRWLRDKFKGVPAEANRIFDRARGLYLRKMKGVVAKVAKVVVGGLNAAKKRIAVGRKDVADYVASLPQDLQQVGASLASDVQSKFDALDESVEAKQGELVQKVASKYNEAKSEVDAKVDELKAANQGLWNAIKNKVGEVIKTIRQLKQALTEALKGAADAIALIITSPKKFLNNLIAAIGNGLRNFMKNIAGHLQKGIIGWLTGAVTKAGIKPPESFDLKGIVSLIVQVMGLTYQHIRGRVVKKLGPGGEGVVGKVEQGMAVMGQVATEGPVALWSLIVERVGDVKQMVIDQLKQYLITRVIMAGITWIIGLLNPVAGFIKACKAIINIVMWFWQNASRVAELMSTIAGSIKAIATGAIGQASAAVENALARALPLVIGFLASLLGLGGISKKVRSVIDKLRKPVNKVVDTVVGKAVKMGRKLLNSKLGKKVRNKIKQGKEYVKNKIDQAKRKGHDAMQKTKKKVFGGDDSPQGKEDRLKLAMDSAVTKVNKYAGRPVAKHALTPILYAIRKRRNIGYLEPIPTGDVWSVEGRVDRMSKRTEANTQPGERGDNEAVPDGVLGLDDFNWNPKSVPTFGHVFSTHGRSRPREELVDRAKTPGQHDPQGQWTASDADVASLIRSQFEAIISLDNQEPHEFDLPPGYGHMIRGDGSKYEASRARIVRRKSDPSTKGKPTLLATGYPCE